ncbi:DEAD/DEAH box helicase family protein [Trichomonas vaginalis G3]|uniref:DEAD/DEAH box helicase family protein n=1 Tax=Trichomonas vaginalis (strain ATCC PRA-98 / G3) TaxID=412133 RepID=A2FBA2_TRIV3|nr:ATP-dependent RNA and DNA helicase family [Trichomonas vaginalis G3]EAX97832.1 DEAD/DEAH box helicase family protein [Trichomonas vaginalis G3]KAI5490372.1 ATP-dependent RNA and DNA helicase family [Trichomonas vaginalis G3]|eukprot:XP_001310762.1 DEAD/DEAH box helicase family protein [Trichomonas vaginalis G3]
MKSSAIEDLIPKAPQASTVKFEIEGDNVLHFAALPDGTHTLEDVKFPEEPYLKYDFEFDEFQKCAIACVHNKESVLVSAHTSAGKTVIAKYAIVSALQNNSRVVYTSPIKALSNQKYKELADEFEPRFGKGCVGLLTGDVTINPSASVLVMTTEILRMMLFMQDTLIRELSWVVYDEVHYMKDRSRGVVWEESIIMLPDDVRFVFLSATIPNAREFSEWIATTHKQVCHVVYTERRPVPLHFYLSPLGQPKPYMVRNAEGEINDQQFALACASVKSNAGASKTFGSVQVKSSETTKSKVSKKALGQHTCKIIENLYNSNLYPMIVFVFSRKECDNIHESLGERTFLKPEEKYYVTEVFQNAIQRIPNEADRNLPQIKHMKRLVERGIGVHHGGLMPILKEVVELLFQYHLIKVLFATETFSMGLNMPAKTVVFNSLQKFDGNELRTIHTSEFIQMAGRAGRRNKDQFGAVVINYGGEPSPADLKALMTSGAQPLNSEFRVTYNMILNSLTSANGNPKRIMRSSFHQFQMERQIPELKRRLNEIKTQADAIELTDAEKTKLKVEMQEKLRLLQNKMKKMIFDEENAKNFLIPGKIVKLREWGYCVVVTPPHKGVLTVISNAVTTIEGNVVPPSKSKAKSQPTLISVGLTEFEEVSPHIVTVSFDSLNNKMVSQIMKSVDNMAKSGISNVNHRDLCNEKFREEYLKSEEEYNRLLDSVHALGDVDEKTLHDFITKRNLEDEIETLNKKISDMELLANQGDLDAMMQLLLQLGFVEEVETMEGKGVVITLKGRVAASVNSCDEIVITELLVNGWIKPEYSASMICSILSCFISEEKNDKPDLEGYEDQWKTLQNTASKIADMSLACGVPLDKEIFMSQFNPSFVKLVESWAMGADFQSIMKDYPTYYEGSIVRTIKRLDELLGQVSKAADIFGNKSLAEYIEKEARPLINRGIVFTKSLYLNEEIKKD